MRVLLLSVLLLCAASTAQADDGGESGKHRRRPQVSSLQCGLATPFNVLADSGGIWLYRSSGAPREVFFHDGELSIDRAVRTVSAEDAQRLRAMEQQVRALMPQVAGLAHDVVDLSYDALGGVIEIMTGSWLNARKVARLREEANGYVDDTLGKGRWDQDAFGGDFETYVQDKAETFKGSIARHLLWQIATGRAERMEARADAIGDALDARIESQSVAIEEKAEALCTQVAQLRDLEAALTFRYQGQPLQLLSAIDAAVPAGDGEADTRSAHIDQDRPRDTAIHAAPSSAE